jgi:hypothetical protein
MASTPTSLYFKETPSLITLSSSSIITQPSQLPDVPEFSLPSTTTRKCGGNLGGGGSGGGVNSRTLFMSLFLASYVILGITLFSFTWILLYTFNPSFVKVTHQTDIFPRPGAEPDTVKCFIYSSLLSIFCLVIFWTLTRCI